MIITLDELRNIKHQLPTGSVRRIAHELEIEEQAVRNYFGANEYSESTLTGKHVQKGPNGGIVNLRDTRILDRARAILHEQQPS